jgi:hypothetical protein
MTRGFRVALAAVAALFVIGVVVQVFFAGMAVFGAGEWSTHIDFGYGVAGLPVIMLLLAWPAHSGRSLALLSLALLVVAQVQTSLPLLRDDLPVVAALHPVNALLVFGLGIVVARRSFDLASARSVAPPAPRPSEETAT